MDEETKNDELKNEVTPDAPEAAKEPDEQPKSEEVEAPKLEEAPKPKPVPRPVVKKVEEPKEEAPKTEEPPKLELKKEETPEPDEQPKSEEPKFLICLKDFSVSYNNSHVWFKKDQIVKQPHIVKHLLKSKCPVKALGDDQTFVCTHCGKISHKG
jgi:hypothetical protein